MRIFFAIPILFVCSFTRAQTQTDLQTCIQQQVNERRIFPNHVASENRYQPGESAKVQEFYGGDEYATMAYFTCQKIRLSGKFNSQGVFDSSSAMQGLKILRSASSVGARIREILVADDDNKILYSKSYDAYSIQISDYLGFAFSSLLAQEPNASISRLREISKWGIPVSDIWLTSSNLVAIDSLYQANAFKEQRGSVTGLSVTGLIGEFYSYATRHRDNSYTINLGSVDLGDLGRLPDFLANQQEVFQQAKKCGVTINGDYFYAAHVGQIYDLIGPDCTPISLILETYSDSFPLFPKPSFPELTGNCTAEGTCQDLVLHVPKKNYGSNLNPRDIQRAKAILVFFAKKQISVPETFTLTTIDNLERIGRQWADNLPIKKIRLTDSANSIAKEGKGLTVYLNPNSPFQGYTEVINDFYDRAHN